MSPTVTYAEILPKCHAETDAVTLFWGNCINSGHLQVMVTYIPSEASPNE
jgi:hypothetical protein